MIIRNSARSMRRTADGGRSAHPGGRAGITLTEILISIMILGIGLISLATLFPIGMLRLRDATRYTRSATLLQTAASDAIAREMLLSSTFQNADTLNYLYNSYGLSPWFPSAYQAALGTFPPSYNPMVFDTPYYGSDYYDQTNGVVVGASANPFAALGLNNPAAKASVPGLPFAYDPLWRYQTLSTSGALNPQQGYYPGDTYEARFGYGLTTVRADSFNDPTGNNAPSAHGLQRITNFNRPYIITNGVELPIMPASMFVPNVFVSQEDAVWQDPKANTYTVNPTNGPSATPVIGPSPVLPDLSPPVGSASGGSPSLDWRYSWMYTGQLNSSGSLSCFDGNIVIFENRQFGINTAVGPFAPPGVFSTQNYQVDGETVVEGVFGFSTNVITPGGPGAQGSYGYGAAADKTVLLRWSESMADPVVRPGDWIADVTYERQGATVLSRFYGWSSMNTSQNTNFPYAGLQNWANKLECDNLPPQRCFWYQVQKVGTPAPDAQIGGHRSMVVFVNQTLQARTILSSNGTPAFLNACLIAPSVVNVIPQTIFIRTGSAPGGGSSSGW